MPVRPVGTRVVYAGCCRSKVLEARLNDAGHSRPVVLLVLVDRHLLKHRVHDGKRRLRLLPAKCSRAYPLRSRASVLPLLMLYEGTLNSSSMIMLQVVRSIGVVQKQQLVLARRIQIDRTIITRIQRAVWSLASKGVFRSRCLIATAV